MRKSESFSLRALSLHHPLITFQVIASISTISSSTKTSSSPAFTKTKHLLTTMKLAFMSFLVASTSALVHAEALQSNIIVLSVLTASARSVEGHLRQDTSPTLDEQPFIDGDETVLKANNGRFLNAINWNWNHFPWLSNAMKINNNAVILEEPDIIEDEDDPRYHRLPSFTSISAFVDQQGPSESSSISSHPAFADQEHGASASYTLAHGRLRKTQAQRSIASSRISSKMKM